MEGLERSYYRHADHVWTQLLPAQWTRWQEAAGWTWQNPGGSLWSPRHQKCCDLHQTGTHKSFGHKYENTQTKYSRHWFMNTTGFTNATLPNQKVTSEPATQVGFYSVQNRRACTNVPHSSSWQSASEKFSINKWETPAVFYELGHMHREAWGVNGGGVLYQDKHVNNSKVIPFNDNKKTADL